MLTYLDSRNHGNSDSCHTERVDMQRPAGVARAALGLDGASPSGSHLNILYCLIYSPANADY